MREIIMASAFAALAITAAHADQITLGNSPANAWDIAGTGSSHPLAVTGGPFAASALFGADLGTAHFGLESMDTSSAAAGVFPVIAQTGLPGSGETLDINFAASLDDGSLNPHVSGTFTYTASGDAPFLAAFGASGTAPIDMIFQQTPLTLENWDADLGVTVSSGEIDGQPTSMREPATLALLGSALLGLGLFRWRGRRGSFVGLGGPC